MFNLWSNEITEITGSRLISIFLWLTFNQIVFGEKKKTGKQCRREEFLVSCGQQTPRKITGSSGQTVGNFQSEVDFLLEPRQRRGGRRGAGPRLGGFKIAAGGQKKKKWLWDAAVCINHKPLKRDVMTDSHAPQSQLKLWLIFVRFYLLWCISFFLFFFSCSLLPKASERVQTWTSRPTLYAHGGFMLLQCAWLMQHRAIWPSAWMDWNVQMQMHSPQ